MTKERENELPQDSEQRQNMQGSPEEEKIAETDKITALEKALKEITEKHIRLYADFENYKKVTARNKEELLKYANEDLMKDILTVIDHLELALQHSSDNKTSNSLAEGVELTLKELKNVLTKHGLSTIEAFGKPFDPSVHHAMTKIESEDAEENTVVKEFRKGYMLRDRVLRAALVGVAAKPSLSGGSESKGSQNQTVTKDKN